MSTILWDQILNDILLKFNASVGSIHRLDPKDNHLYLIAVTKGVPEKVLKATQRIPLGKGIAGTAALTKKPVTMCNLQTDTSGIAKPDAKMTKSQSSLCVPIFYEGEVIGTLGIGHLVEREFTPDEEKELITIAQTLADKLYTDFGVKT